VDADIMRSPPWLNRARALAPLRLAKIALARVRPAARIAIKNFAEFVDYFRSNPDFASGQRFRLWPRLHAPLSIEHASQQFRASPAVQSSFLTWLRIITDDSSKSRCLFAAKKAAISSFLLVSEANQSGHQSSPTNKLLALQLFEKLSNPSP